MGSYKTHNEWGEVQTVCSLSKSHVIVNEYLN